MAKKKIKAADAEAIADAVVDAINDAIAEVDVEVTLEEPVKETAVKIVAPKGVPAKPQAVATVATTPGHFSRVFRKK